ncbi:EAL and HDOD domain-containing protein [Cellulomonas massiliensis]|uniref:EAL and HDOD domain-containing protein n=1 Tax=Cellulomonas massiliensis TaxID=1465811 RepID=UPI0002FCC5DC|nr:EAL domain-containing protein [Cellulomonas massiliensis]
MTHADDAGLAQLARAVEDAIPDALRREWIQREQLEPVLVARQAIFTSHGRPFAYQLSYRSPDRRTTAATLWSRHQHERATEHVLGATFGRANLEHVAHGRLLFVRCPRAFLVGDLPIPRRPDRLVIEVTDAHDVDAEVVAGLRRLREDGFRIALASFVDTTHQRRLLPLADFVKIDVRDLDVEGHPVVEVARSYGAALVAEYVESPETLRAARDLGFTLFQGNLLERAGVLDRTHARRVSL